MDNDILNMLQVNLESALANLKQSESIADFRLQEMARLMGERDALLAALKHLAEDADAIGMSDSRYSGGLIEARAAIAQVRK